MNRLRELRQQAGISQAKFAKKMSVAQNTVSNWETGTRIMDTETAGKVADYFGVSVDYLIGKTNHMKEGVTIAEVYDMLYKKLVDNGIIKEGKDLTPDQLDNYLKKLGKIVSTFRDNIDWFSFPVKDGGIVFSDKMIQKKKAPQTP